MKKLLLTLAAIPAAVIASQASAQSYANPNAGYNLTNRIANLEARFSAGAQNGAFDQREYQRLYSRLGQLRAMEQQYSYNGLSSGERRTLQAQIRAVRDEMRMAGGNGWANRYGWTDRDLDYADNGYGSAYGNGYGNAYGNANTRYDAYGRPIPNGGVVYDRYGRPVANSGYYGQGGPYEPVYAPRSNGAGNVLGGVLGSVMGGGGGVLGSVLGGGGIGVGSVITGAIANILRGGNNYGYRDNDRTYFRSDGQQVYEIDSRTNQVVRIHPLR